MLDLEKAIWINVYPKRYPGRWVELVKPGAQPWLGQNGARAFDQQAVAIAPAQQCQGRWCRAENIDTAIARQGIAGQSGERAGGVGHACFMAP